MMDWNGDGGWPNDGVGSVLMILGMVVFWGLIIAAIVLVVRRPAGQDRATAGSTLAPRTPQQMLADRFAAGEIDEAEFISRLDALRSRELL